MSTAATEAYPSGLVISRDNLLFDFPEADLILRSRDLYEFRVLKRSSFISSIALQFLERKSYSHPTLSPSQAFLQIPPCRVLKRTRLA